MHPTTSRLMYASLATAALGLAGIAAVQSSAQPAGPIPPPVQLSRWVQATPNAPLQNCPLTAAAGTPQLPFFGFSGTPQSCLMDGPYPFDDKSWFTQRIKHVPGQTAGIFVDVVRACSLGAAHLDDPNKFVGGPCRTTAGVGPRGCEVCQLNGAPVN